MELIPYVPNSLNHIVDSCRVCFNNGVALVVEITNVLEYTGSNDTYHGKIRVALNRIS